MNTRFRILKFRVYTKEYKRCMTVLPLYWSNEQLHCACYIRVCVIWNDNAIGQEATHVMTLAGLSISVTQCLLLTARFVSIMTRLPFSVLCVQVRSVECGVWRVCVVWSVCCDMCGVYANGVCAVWDVCCVGRALCGASAVWTVNGTFVVWACGQCVAWGMWVSVLMLT